MANKKDGAKKQKDDNKEKEPLLKDGLKMNLNFLKNFQIIDS